MTKKILNKELLPGNACFGCGHDNPNGLHIEVQRDDNNPERIVGTFVPTKLNAGFPGIAHGGAVYTVLDCLATWTVATLRSEPGAIWILRSASAKYHRPTPIDQPVTLTGEITEQGDLWQAVVIRTEARNARGDLLVEGTFRTIPLTEDKFKEVTGVKVIPENWRQFFERRGDA